MRPSTSGSRLLASVLVACIATLGVAGCSDDGDAEGGDRSTTAPSSTSSNSSAPIDPEEAAYCASHEAYPTVTDVPTGASPSLQLNAGILSLRLGYGGPGADPEREPWLALSVDSGEQPEGPGTPTTVATAGGSWDGVALVDEVQQPGVTDPRTVRSAFWEVDGHAVALYGLDVTPTQIDEALDRFDLVDQGAFVDFQDRSLPDREAICA